MKKYQIIIVAALSVIAVSAFLLKDDPKKTLKSFWEQSLSGNFAEADKLSAQRGQVRRSTKGTSGGSGTIAENLDGTVTYFTNKENIFGDQIKITDILDRETKGYQVGFLLETTDKNEKQEKYIACLGQAKVDDKWLVYLVEKATESIEKTCE